MCRFSIAQGCGGWQGGGGGRESAGLRVSSAGAFPRLCQRRMANGLRRKSRRCRAPACRRSGHAFVEMEEGAEDPSHAMRSGGVHAARSGCRPLSPSYSGGRFAHRKMAFFRRPDAPAALQATDRRQGFVDGLKDGYAIRWLGARPGLADGFLRVRRAESCSVRSSPRAAAGRPCPAAWARCRPGVRPGGARRARAPGRRG